MWELMGKRKREATFYFDNFANFLDQFLVNRNMLSAGERGVVSVEFELSPYSRLCRRLGGDGVGIGCFPTAQLTFVSAMGINRPLQREARHAVSASHSCCGEPEPDTRRGVAFAASDLTGMSLASSGRGVEQEDEG